jgi:hypothetical protein
MIYNSFLKYKFSYLSLMRRSAFILFLTLPVLYCVLYAPCGFDDTDQGFVQALSWRITQGEIPYLDFDYVRPPVTPYLHALEMLLLPEGYEVLGARCIMYLMMWGSVIFTVLAFRRAFRWQPDARIWLVAATSFVFTAHNYPPMPWHTIDAVFFVALGAWLLTRNARTGNLLLAMFSLVLAALCKQPFAILLPLAPFAANFLHHRRAAFTSALSIAGCLLLITGLLFLIHPEMPGQMFAQMASASEGTDLLVAGLFRYKWGLLLSLPLISISLLPPAMRRWAGWLMPAVVVLTAMSLHIWRAALAESSVEPSFHFMQALMVTAVFFAGRMFFFRKQKAWVLPLFLLAGAWAAGISWGYQTPELFAAPIWITVMLMFSGESQLRLPFLLHGGLLLTTFATYFYLYQFPYRDEPRSVGYVSLGRDEPRLKGIYAGPEEAHELEALRQLTDQTAESPGSKATWTVFPSMPLAHYLHNQLNPLSSDWEHNAEMAQGLKQQQWAEKLNTNVKRIYVEKNKLAQLEGMGKYDCGRCSILMRDPWMETDPDPISPFRIYLNFDLNK